MGTYLSEVIKVHCEFKQNYFVMNRGDTFELPIVINAGTDYEFKQYELTDTDKIYIGIMEPNQSFENALIRKVITKGSNSIIGSNNKGSSIYNIYINIYNIDLDKAYLFKLDPIDTEYILTGKYYIMIKLYQYIDNREKVTTLLPMKEFFIEGTNKQISDKNFVTHTINLNGDDCPVWEQI